MDKKLVGIIAGIAVIIAIGITVLAIPNSQITPQETNEKIGLVVNSPSQSVTLQSLDQIYSEAASSGIGRSNVYLFWNLVEPVRGEFDWKQSDALMSFNKKNNLKVTLYFSVINGETLGPFPSWIGKPPIISIGEDRVVSVLDAILSRYDIIDTVILSGQTESQFRFNEQNIPVYKELFNGVYEKTKEKHPDVKIGNSFALHQVINKNLRYIVTDLAMGDFVAFSYSPVDTLNDIVKTPQEAKEDLQQVFDLAGDKKVGIFELSWSTSDFVGGNSTEQTEFLEKSFEFYTENESELEFFTWYRQYDRPDGTCLFEEHEIGEDKLSVGGSGFGSSEHVIERLNQYICSAGLINSDGTPKPGWIEFKNQIEMIN
ncbi:hypothetical protein C6990_00560 [Nitrosopumilus sp. b3]|uniref:hypothetical protein n=1 Tax=Nitrosopumilus sp. b3 TaxID=2109909 RepID=UPI0015F6451B|nr:hypothetical protein [Nitrosopumilus sp. b3]KAF6247976.1 hypothetical protein C6990_00560 [Nitrosopumilus sp. b3]